MSALPPLKLYLAAPRGFCAGVDRAIRMVEMALEKFGAPVYVRHEIVHNKFVVDGLRDKGAVFVETLDECPADRPVVFSAHGVPKAVPEEAKRREMFAVDAVCPLVTKVHVDAARHAADGAQVILIGHAGHPEVLGTMGQLSDDEMLLVETVADVETLEVGDPENLAFVTQTTLSVDDTAEIIARCNAGSRPSRRRARKTSATPPPTGRRRSRRSRPSRRVIVIGAPNSSNSQRLVEVGAQAGCKYSVLAPRAKDIDWRSLEGIKSVGITAGASAPEELVTEVIAAFRARYIVEIETVETAVETVEFKAPRSLREKA